MERDLENLFEQACALDGAELVAFIPNRPSEDPNQAHLEVWLPSTIMNSEADAP